MPPGRPKIFLLGIDGLPPETFHRFVAEGRMPHFARLLERALVLDMIPTLPALTAPGWLSIASGACPSAIGVENLLLPTPGKAPDFIRNGFDSRQSRAEYLWETLDRHGLSAIVLKFPGSWPPRDGNFLQIDGAGGYADILCRFEDVSSGAYVTTASANVRGEANQMIFPVGYVEHWRTHTGPATGLYEVLDRQPVGWRGVPEGAEPVFETVLHVAQPGRTSTHVIHGLAYRFRGQARLALSLDKDASPAAIHLGPGQWSHFVMAQGPNGCYAYRFKLLDLNLDHRQLHVYRTEGHRLEGFTRPAALAEELVREVGPMVEWAGTYDLMNGLVDLETQLEIYEQHTNWMARAIRYLGRTRPWQGFFTQWHLIEYAHHLMGASLHSDHPLHPVENVARDINFLGEVYGLADRLLEAVESVMDDCTLLMVASDHGHDLVHTIFYINHFLLRKGWLQTTTRNDRPVVDWTGTAAYGLFPGCLYLNVEGRWPGGIVKARDADSLAERIAEALRSQVDPRTGRHPIKVVLNREELVAFGQTSSAAPDLFFCMDRGYEPASRILHGPNDHIEFELTIPYRDATSGHGSFFPLSRSARTLALLAGPGIDPKSVDQYPVPVVDLAPTMAAFLGISHPKHCEGRPLRAVRFGNRLEPERVNE